MKLKTLAAAALAVTALASCTANKTKETAMEETKEPAVATTLQPDSINLATLLGEENRPDVSKCTISATSNCTSIILRT